MSVTRPVVLISSSGDLASAREELGKKLRQGLRDISLQINPYLWEEETEEGRTIEPGTPIQKQINAMLAGRVQTTIVMFGERIGEPLTGEPVEGTSKLIEDWEHLGLLHPWPEAHAERWAALDEGHFPLTGTTYELLVALQQNAIQEQQPDKYLKLRIGYCCDKPITPDTTRGSVTLNEARYYRAPRRQSPSGQEQEEWEAKVYNQQVQGVLNLIKALAKSPHGTHPHRYEKQEAMVEGLLRLAIADLKRLYPTEAYGAVFKPDLSPYRVEDPMPLPDREDLRERLKSRMLADCERGEILALRGSSGCGKSSLLQKGLLGADPKVKANGVPVVLRPTDLAASDKRTPLLRFVDLLAGRLEIELGILPNLRDPSGGQISRRIENAIDTLVKALESNRTTLLLGIDQFEEVIDQAGLDSERQRGRPDSWWQILHFVGKAARERNILVAVTVESQRYDRIEEMGVKEVTGIDLSYVNVDFEVSDVAEFVQHTASRRDLPLSPKVATAVERMVEDFEKRRREASLGSNTASFLPLLSLWLHRLFVKFQDRQKKRSGDSAANAFGRTAEPIGMEDLKNRGIDMKLGPLISELVEDAWAEAGALQRTELVVTDQPRLIAFIRDFVSRTPGGNDLISHCSTEKGFDLERFINILCQNHFSEIPGVELPRLKPSARSLENFFGGLVGVDDNGNMRLTSMPRDSDTTTVSKLITTHLRRRLLEPIVSTGRVRLVHQAVIDNWPPAKEWYKSKTSELIVARNIKQAARGVGESPNFETLAEDADLVAQAAAVLGMKRAVWASSFASRIGEFERETRDFCLQLVAAAPDGRLLDATTGGYQKPIAFEAARYDLADTLERWISADPGLVDAKDASGDTLLDKAAWFAPKAVKVLLAHGANHEGGDRDWHPIAGAIQAGNVAGLKALLGKYDGPASVIGPESITMLHEAARSPSSESMRELLNNAGNVDPRTDSRITPLLFAAWYGQAEIAELLLDFGACPLARDNNSANILSLAALSNSSRIVNLVRDWISDAESEKLLFGDEATPDRWLTPIDCAATKANPEALAALLSWIGDAPIHTGNVAGHPLVVALQNNQGYVSQPMADRISRCVSLLLDKEGVPPAVIEEALPKTRNLPDVRRLIENYTVLHAPNIDGIDPEIVLTCITGSRPDIAAEALRRRPSILDHHTEDGTPAIQSILHKADKSVLLTCLKEGFEPKIAPTLFRFEAALRICRDAIAEGLPNSDLGSDASQLPLVFPGVDRESLHPVIRAIVEEPYSERSQYLLSIGGSDKVRSLLHRLAVRGNLELYSEIVQEMRAEIPLDIYGRLPSESAPPTKQQEFEEFEHSTPSMRDN